MSKTMSYVLVFVVGFVVCALSIYWLFGSPTSFGPESSVLTTGGELRVARSGSNQIAKAAAEVSSYVVNIDTVGRPQEVSPQMGGPPGMPPGMPPGFFGQPFGQPQEVVPRGMASGVIFTQDGYILTNNHVVAEAANLSVTLHDGKNYQAKLIGRDPKTDIAVIKIDASGLPFAKFADSDSIAVGDWVIAVGNSLGLGPTVTVGVVSATKRGPINIEGKTLEQVIQTDAAINRGNSGGALADINGDLVGINSAIASSGPDGGSIGIGFAVPSNTAKTISAQIMKTGEVVRPWLGIKYTGFDAEARKAFSARGGATKPPDQDGVQVMDVLQGSPAAQAGLKPYDIILKVNGKSLSAQPKPESRKVVLGEEISRSSVGDRITLDVWHSDTGRISSAGVILGKMPVDIP